MHFVISKLTSMHTMKEKKKIPFTTPTKSKGVNEIEEKKVKILLR